MSHPPAPMPATRNTLAALAAAGALTTPATHAFEGWDWTLESGYLWGLRNNTVSDYEVAPTLFTLRGPSTWEIGGWVVRPRFSALAAAFTEGPESYYFGLAAAPSIERQLTTLPATLFVSVGGGIGLTDSSGGQDGLGHDFTLNWFAQAGIRHRLTETLDWQASVFFLHLSNGGRTTPNPAVDALGVTLGITRRF